ncbi:MAG: YceI family protein [Actinomycetota bacterium]|nr:YceI family protein [Actinomycetota bacterium]
MPLKSGAHPLGPHNATLLVDTRRTGAAAKAGHDLTIEVTSWSGRLETDESGQTQIALDADGGSLRVREGRGGIQALGEHDKESVRESIDDEVLKRSPIEFRSRAVETSADGSRLRVKGELVLLGNRRPIEFELTAGEGGRLTGSATVKQSDWGLKPFSTLFGTLKVVDEVEITIDADLTSD